MKKNLQINLIELEKVLNKAIELKETHNFIHIIEQDNKITYQISFNREGFFIRNGIKVILELILKDNVNYTSEDIKEYYINELDSLLIDEIKHLTENTKWNIEKMFDSEIYNMINNLNNLEVNELLTLLHTLRYTYPAFKNSGYLG